MCLFDKFLLLSCLLVTSLCPPLQLERNVIPFICPVFAISNECFMINFILSRNIPFYLANLAFALTYYGLPGPSSIVRGKTSQNSLAHVGTFVV